MTLSCGDDDNADATSNESISTVSTDSNRSVINTESGKNELQSSTQSTVSGNNTNSQISSGGSNSTSGTANSTPSTPATDNSPKVVLSATKNGDTVTVTASVKNNSGLTGFELKLNYDKNTVTPETFKNSNNMDITSNLMQPNADCNGQVTAVYVSANGFKNDGELFSVEFKIKDKNAAKTEFSLKTESNSFVNLNVQYVTFATQDVSVDLK